LLDRRSEHNLPSVTAHCAERVALADALALALASVEEEKELVQDFMTVRSMFRLNQHRNEATESKSIITASFLALARALLGVRLNSEYRYLIRHADANIGA